MNFMSEKETYTKLQKCFLLGSFTPFDCKISSSFFLHVMHSNKAFFCLKKQKHQLKWRFERNKNIKSKISKISWTVCFFLLSKLSFFLGVFWKMFFFSTSTYESETVSKQFIDVDSGTAESMINIHMSCVIWIHEQCIFQ